MPISDDAPQPSRSGAARHIEGVAARLAAKARKEAAPKLAAALDHVVELAAQSAATPAAPAEPPSAPGSTSDPHDGS